MRRVELAPRALAQVRRIDHWWRENRPSAPTLFADELSRALERLMGGSVVGTRYVFDAFEVRRMLLPRSRYHVYYSIEGEYVKRASRPRSSIAPARVAACSVKPLVSASRKSEHAAISLLTEAAAGGLFH